LQWSVSFAGQQVVDHGKLEIRLENGEVLGREPKVIAAKEETINATINSPFYKKATVSDVCKQLTVTFKNGYGIICRAYNDGVAYRFFTARKDSLIIQSETASFNFNADFPGFIPLVHSSRSDRFEHSYEDAYRHIPLSAISLDSLVYLPVMLSLKNNVKAVISEADLENYPAMYLQKDSGIAFNTIFPSYPLTEKQGGYNMTQSRVTSRASYIARTAGTRSFPWRMIAFSEDDKELLNSDLVYKLAAPVRINDVSWIKPGKVAWDWWNDWNISHVDFKAGINTQTYKAYIDFAAAWNLEYIMLDEGWAEKGNIMNIVPAIDLRAIIDYGKQKNVGVWLWAGMYPVNDVMDTAFAFYSKMGVKGFKIDFINRDDQVMMEFYYRAAQKAAAHHLLLDFHGACKPTGLMRTYPNVLNYEGVYGLEMAKFPTKVDFPEHAASIPFIRMLAGAMDYTPGAMRNSTRKDFYPSVSNPMSQGTRCQQLAMYIVFESPLNMLSDNPTAYMKEQECTEFIAGVPTVFDETIALTGKVGKYAAIARRKGNTWYVGALGNWDAHELEIDLSFLDKGSYKAIIFKDGINTDRSATDYDRVEGVVNAATKHTVHLAPGGGWAATFTRQ
ncbi:MAG: glycoside hydrolase family 97 protein, partial [Chitinophagaceae bacterium]|nr:glycoside hydrolase family 97 protein [Chitinophagaceae bacterium]